MCPDGRTEGRDMFMFRFVVYNPWKILRIAYRCDSVLWYVSATLVHLFAVAQGRSLRLEA
jgi:hypothetical protein